MASTSSRPLRVATVGLGWVGTHRHIPWLQRTEGIEVVGVIDHNARRLAATCEQFRIPLSASASDPAQIEWLDRVDAVTIATAPFSHRDLTIAFLDAGKHVLVEKPMALDSTAASEMAAAASAHARVLAVVHNFQFARSVVRARQLLDTGRLGELREVWGVQLSNPQRRLPVWYDSLPLGLFFDESPHFFYLMRHFLGDALHVSSARVRPHSDPSHATPRSVSVDLDGGRAPGRIEMNFMAPLSEWQLVIVGSRKLALIDIFRDILVVLANDGEHNPGQILRTSADAVRGHLWGTLTSGVRFARGSLAYGNDEVIRRFRNACIGEGSAVGISAADGQAVVELQHGVVLSAASQ